MKFSDEMINAYADGELQGNEKAEFESALQNDIELQQALNEVNELKEQLRQAYNYIDVPVHVTNKPVNYRIAVYAGFLLLAFSSGWFSGEMMHQSNESTAQTKLLAQQAGQATEEQSRYILHVGTHDNEKFKRALDKAEAIMAKYQNDMQLIELEIIANADGLDLFREGATPYADRVKQLGKRYPNIRFIACSNALERLREKGVEANLINSVHTGPTALDQVVKRMNQGWTYIKI